MATQQGALAKLSRPRLHDVLVRTRLFDQLDRALQRPVAWLYAQPGAGKTTLVASYLHARKRDGIWYQVDDGDADPASFIYHLRLKQDADLLEGLRRLGLDGTLQGVELARAAASRDSTTASPRTAR